MKRKNIRFNGSLTFRPIESLTLKAMYARRSTTSTDGYYQTKKHVSTTKSGVTAMHIVMILILIII